MMRITTNRSEIDLHLAHRWIASSYWSTNIPWERFERACANSLVYAAFDDDDQVGFARVVTDSATFAWLCDVFVAEHARGRGVGQRLIASVMADDRLRGLRQLLLATRDAHGLYLKFGFQRVGDPDDRFMRIARPLAEVYGA
ncbi:MAG TPA: GNAT family N-acetyltransferase [Candidatus Acidoferrum sp.]|nr:GNAT family N-acetyltransferase [Candidatus Acidoferrum sp.]